MRLVWRRGVHRATTDGPRRGGLQRSSDDVWAAPCRRCLRPLRARNVPPIVAVSPTEPHPASGCDTGVGARQSYAVPITYTCGSVDSFLSQRREVNPVPDPPSKAAPPAWTPLTPSEKNCTIYESERHWLPDAYVTNATCACTNTPDSKEMNCIRGYLQDLLINVDGEFKKRAADIKKKNAHNIWQMMAPLGIGWLQHLQTVDPEHIKRQLELARFMNEFTDMIYGHHVLAYKMCGCSSGPAPRLTWDLVTRRASPFCKLIEWSIDGFGECETSSKQENDTRQAP